MRTNETIKTNFDRRRLLTTAAMGIAAAGLLLTLCASASAATMYHSRTNHPVSIPPSVALSLAAVPGGVYPTMHYTPSYNDPSRFGGDEALPAQ
jgi:hypothetical protein